jgi:hypothetical protein
MESYGMLAQENREHVPEQDQDLLLANSLQLAWAEHESEKAKELGKEIDSIDFMVDHAAWFRKEVIENPDHHELIEAFEKDPEATVIALKKLFEESEEATKH